MSLDKDNILISIVTICFNAENGLEKTMNSVLSQTYNNIEYIIKDGGSTDRTNEVIVKYKKKFEQKKIRYINISQKDQGIYDAMNQATDIASGKYINYMNAGDVFFNENVLTDIFENNKLDSDIIYGNSVCEYEFIKDKKEYTLWKGQSQSFVQMPFSHQACFLSTDLVKQYHYDTSFKSAADFHLLSRLFMDGKTFYNSDCMISICTMKGVSNTEIKRSYMESIRVKKELGMTEFLSRDTLFSLWFMGVKQWVLKSIPYVFVGRLLRMQVKRRGALIYDSIAEIQKAVFSNK